MLTPREKRLAWIGGGLLLALALLRGAPAAIAYFSKPKGRQGVLDTYGDFAYQEGAGGRVVPDPQWVADNIVDVDLHTGQTVKFHQLVANELAQVFAAACTATATAGADWCPSQVETYVPRHINWDTSKPLSYHSWGIAVDFDPSDNPRQGTGTVELHPAFVQAFTDAGWSWGGNWKGASRDPMHFEALRE